ncbi:MAG: M3 family oligoendopeptidase [Ferrovibrionaceae bacterium]
MTGNIAAEDLGPLPTWNLTDLYAGPDAPALKADIAAAKAEAEAYAARYKGRIGELDGDALAAAIADYERQQDRLGRIGSYAGLYHAEDLTDAARGRFAQTTREALNEVYSALLFFTLELNRIEDADLAAKYEASSGLRHYEPFLRDVRSFRPHQLGDDLEALLLDKSVTGSAAWVRLYDEMLAGWRVPLRGQELSLEQALANLSEPDRVLRAETAVALDHVFDHDVRTIALVMNTIVKDKAVEDKWRKFPTPAASRHLANFVEEETVAALAAAVRESYPRLSHRYYRLKAKWLGLDKLAHYDRNAPLPEADERSVPWREAEKTVLDAYGRFSPRLADLGRQFFEKNWIDVPARPGKAGGAFAHPTVPSAHPYLLLNYQGRLRDVMTLAHELGHGVHQVLAAEQGALMCDTPLTLAETASVFGEQLTFRALLAQTSGTERRIMLARKVEDMLNTVVRQTAFYEFERRVHAARAEGELSVEDLDAHWLAVQTESLGDAFSFDDTYRHYWCYISHFIHAPFYVYAYAFGDCLVNALYAAYEAQPDGFAEKYFAMLRAGGTLRHKELLAPFGLDATDPAFWSKGLDLIGRFIDELEQP